MSYNSRLQFIIAFKSRQELKQLVLSTLKGERNEYMHIACLLLSLISPFTEFRIFCLRNGASHSGLCLPTSINNQDNPPQTHPQGKSDLSNFSLRPSSWVILGCVKLTVKSAQSTPCQVSTQTCHYEQ